MIELSEPESNALQDYAKRAMLVPGVSFVAATREDGMNVYTGIKRRTLTTCRRLFQILDQVRAEHPNLSADFHLIYAGGRSAESFIDGSRAIILESSEEASNPRHRQRSSTAKEPDIGWPRVLMNVPKPIPADDLLPWLGRKNSGPASDG